MVGVEQNQAAAGQQRCEQFTKGGSVGFRGRAGVAEGGGDLRGAGTFEGGERSGEGRVHSGAEGDLADGSALVILAVGQLDTLEASAAEPVAMIHFGEVVVFAGQPEDRNGYDALGAELLGHADGGEGFIEGVGRAGEERGLLTGHDRDSASGEAIEILGDAGIAAKTPGYGAQSGDQFAMLGDGAARGRGGGANALEGWRVLEIRADPAEIGEIGGGEAAQVRNMQRWEALEAHCGHVTRDRAGRQCRRSGAREIHGRWVESSLVPATASRDSIRGTWR